jgi:methylmalonyl-CoA mutase N-terminal domain/subunit
VAKFRAARRIWYRVMTEEFGARDPRSSRLRFHTQTAGSTLTAQQPMNNVVRTTLEALAAVLGGTQSLHTNSMDEALGLPTEEAARVALRTQQILAEESGVADTVDPLAGSYYVESLTREIESAALDYFEEIDKRGGMISCIESGWIQEQIHQAAYQAQLEVERGDRTVVGVNRYQVEEPQPEMFVLNPALEETQKRRLGAVRDGRPAREVEAALGRLGQAASGSDNLLPPILDAIRVRTSVGEISDVLRGIFGTYDKS